MKKDGFFSSSVIFFVGSFMTALFNYLYHLSMGRMLGPEDYGVLGALFALVYIVMFSTSTFTFVFSKFSAEFHALDKKGQVKELFVKSLQKISLWGGLVLLVYCGVADLIASYLHLSSVVPVILVGVIGYLSIIFALLLGMLNGIQLFLLQNVSNFLSVFLKFGFAVLLVYLGFGVNGALFALVLGLVVASVVAVVPVVRYLGQSVRENVLSRRIYHYFVPVFFATVLSAGLVTVDVLLVKHYFSSAEAGWYAAAGMIAKIIWYGSGFLGGFLFPTVVSLISKKKSTVDVLRKVVGLTSLLVAVGVVSYFLFPGIIVSLLYGSAYLSIVPWIGLFGLAMGLFSVQQILMQYHLAKEQYGFLGVLAAGLVVETVGIMMFHASLSSVIWVVFAVNLFILLGFLVLSSEDLGVKLWKAKRYQ